ncbi:MAG: DUF3891 family protein [Leptolyngbyaceae cyanobacterium SM2_3_12]|nr:DUF3891 family protein [Leptolyngbyaceae cyanobacterium SM2_3_12]
MIVNLRDSGWEIIYHRAHALLAAEVAGYWNFGEKRPHLYQTIAAISHHDDLEKEWEGDELTEAGAPLDFTLAEEMGLENLRQHVQDSLYRGRWVAILTSMHMCFLQRNKAEQNPEVAAFVQEQYQHQAQWREELGLDKDEVEAAYTFMRWCDRLSLILCQRQIPAQGRHLEITNGPDGQTYTIHQLESGHLGVTPWPFTQDYCPLSVDATYLSQLKFDSNEDLRAALKSAPRQTLTWTLARP